MASTDNRYPWDDLEKLAKELELYEEGLSGRVKLIIANKMDGELAAENLEELRKHTELPIFPVVAELGEDTDKVVDQLRVLVEEIRLEVGERRKLKKIYQNGDKIIVNLEDDDDF